MEQELVHFLFTLWMLSELADFLKIVAACVDGLARRTKVTGQQR